MFQKEECILEGYLNEFYGRNSEQEQDEGDEEKQKDEGDKKNSEQQQSEKKNSEQQQGLGGEKKEKNHENRCFR